MSEDAESHTIRLLQDMRKEMRESAEALRKEFADLRDSVTVLNAKVDGMSLIVTLLAGHSARLEKRIAGLEAGTRA